jgi:predicted amidophosphoribosyltransferase
MVAMAALIACIVAARNGHPLVAALALLAFFVLVALSRAKLVCPSCGKVVTILGGTQFQFCPHCGMPYGGDQSG